MADYLIPGWFLFIIGAFLTVFIPWAVWATVKIFANDKIIALARQDQIAIRQDQVEIKENITHLDVKIDTKFDKLDKKLDSFLVQEIAILKQLASR